MAAKKRVYRVTFRNDAEIYEVHCQRGTNKVHAVAGKSGKVATLPTTIYTPGKPPR